jgi:hypothetical protein
MLDIGQRVQFDGHQAKGSELILDYLLCVFEDGIGLGVGCGCNYCLDSVGLKEFLKFNSCEFGSFVVKTDKRSWVATEPGVIKGMSHGVAFFIGNNNQLEQVSDWINHSYLQGLEAVPSHLTLQRVWDFWKGIAELSMAQSSQHELHSMVQYCVEFSLISVHSSCIVICNVDKSDMFGWIVLRHRDRVCQWKCCSMVLVI